MQINLFYIDDEPDICDVFSDEFSSNRIKVTIFTDHKKAVEEIKTKPPNIIFIDYRLPGTTGDQVCMLLDKNIPKYLVTGELNVQTKYEFIKILKKPFETEVIQAILDSYTT